MTTAAPRYGFGDAETEGAALGFGEPEGAVLAGAREFEVAGAGLNVADATADGELVGLIAGVVEPVGEPATEAPGTGVAEATGAGVCPALNSRVRLLGVFALRA